jgi:outer membrane protein assembly factor BamB
MSCKSGKNAREIEDNWESFQHDQQNTGVSSVALSFPLYLNWDRQFVNGPQPAWPAPAKQDYYNGKRKLEPLVTYDRAFQPIVVGNKLFLASSANNSVTCYNLVSGEVHWVFYTGAPNRVAPLSYQGYLYVGSDDGYVYCLSQESGELLWKKSFGGQRTIVGNGRLVSSVPIRTGIVAKGDTLFVAAGLLPEEKVTINACEASSGAILWSKEVKELAPQGYPVLQDSLWYIPNSRVQPMVFSTRNGAMVKKLKGDGGDNISMVDGRLIFGIDWNGELDVRRLLESAITGYKVTGEKGRLFVASDFSVTAIDLQDYADNYREQKILEREIKTVASELKNQSGEVSHQLDSLRSQLERLKSNKFIWQTESSKSFALIKSANALISGQQDRVVAYHPESGEELWSHPVTGRPYGLAVTQQGLIASTDKGHVYCFGKKQRYVNASNAIKQESSNQGVLQKAKELARRFPRKKGFALVVGDASLVESLTQVSDYHFVGTCESDKKLFSSRSRLDESGLYGLKSSLFEGHFMNQQFADYLFNIVIVEDKVDKATFNSWQSDLFRIIAPSGGRILLSRRNGREMAELLLKAYPDQLKLIEDSDYWVIERLKLPGSGEWTHLYANASNTVSTTDRYASDLVRPLWFGQPGPHEMIDRHHRGSSPLFKDGLLIIPGENGVMGVDAYNGTLLWKKDIPNFKRIKISRDAGSVVMDEQAVYAVADNFCYVLNPETGDEKQMLRVPQIKHTSEDAHWGYLASEGILLLGSGRKPSAIFNRYSRLDWSEYSRLVTSNYLFGMNKTTGKKMWSYQGGVILTPSICVGDDKMYFVESHHPDALNDDDGLMTFATLKQDLSVVAIDIHSGQVVWKQAYGFGLIEHILFGSYSSGKLVMSGSGNKQGSLWYGTYAFNGDTGELEWNKEKKHLTWTNGSHGEQIHRAVIMNNVVYTEPFAFDLQTGQEKTDWKLNRNGHSCGNISAADGVLYFRATNPAVCIPDEGSKGQQLNNTTRPGCWINMIPAGGLLMIPEASSGCSCNFPLQMSIVYQPMAGE